MIHNRSAQLIGTPRTEAGIDQERAVLLQTAGQGLFPGLLLHVQEGNNSPFSLLNPVVVQNSRILDQPSSTYVSVTAKGVDIEEYIDLFSPVPGISNFEPLCPEPKRTSLTAFDRLPAFANREALKFYKPEKALKDVSLQVQLRRYKGLLSGATHARP